MTENSPLLPILGQARADVIRGSGRTLHVLTLTPFYPCEGDDGFGCFVAEPLAAMASVGVRNTVFAVQPFYQEKYRTSAAGVPGKWFRYFSIPGGLGLSTQGAFVFARIVPQVRKLHRSQPIDLIHAHAPLPCGHTAMLLSAELGLPYVVSVHGLDAFSTNQIRGRGGEWCRRVSQRVYRSSKRVICVSEHVREEVLRGTGRSCRTSVVYNGVDPDLFSPGQDKPTAGPAILAIGDLIPIKGFDVLLRAFATVASEFPTLTVQIIGEGPELSNLRALSQQFQLTRRVSFLERQSRQQVAEAMRRCTLFVLPSRYEGLGCVYLEAMSVGTPVIGCRGQGIAEVINHGSNGFLVGPDNDRELAVAMAMLLRDERRRHNLGIAARDTILDRFTLAHQAEQLARIYREAVG
jgi:glycosyltransferase involved in cell wall biosynthesis